MYESLLKYTYFTSYSQKCNTCMFQDFINIKTVFKKTSTGHYILRVKIYQLTNLFIVSLIVSTITIEKKTIYMYGYYKIKKNILTNFPIYLNVKL